MPTAILSPSSDAVGGNGTFREWTPSSGTDHGDLLTPAVQFTDYLEATAIDKRETHRMEVTTGTLPGNAVISLVIFNAGDFFYDADVSFAAQWAHLIHDGTTLNTGADQTVGAAVFDPGPGVWTTAPIAVVHATNPITGLAWTTAEILAYNFGMKSRNLGGASYIRTKGPFQLAVVYTVPTGPPVIAVDQRAMGFVKNGGPQVVDGTASVTNDDDVTSLTVQIEMNFISGEDVLAAADAGNVTVSFSGDTLTMTGADSAAVYQGILQGMTFNTSTDPENRTIRLLIQAFDGQGASNLADKFIRIGPPVIETGALSPDEGPTAGGTAVTVTGEGFAATADFWFDNDIATNIVVVNHTTLTCDTPAHALGLVAVSTSNDGLEYQELADAYTYVPPTPFITDIDPEEGPVGGGTACVITGSNFQEGVEVFFGDRLARNIVIVSDTEINCDSPPNKVGLVDVTVSINPSSTLFQAFRYTFIGDFLVRREPAITVRDMLNDAPNSTSFVVDGEEDDGEPTPGEPFEIQVDASGKLFKGTAQSVTMNYEERTEPDHVQLNWEVNGIDNTWLVNRRRPFGRFTDMSITDIAIVLVTDFAPDFTTDHVQTSLPIVSITFNGEEDFATCITRLCQLGGPVKWYLDYDDDLHVFYDTPPDPPSNGLPAPTQEVTPTLSGNAPANNFLAGTYLFKQAFQYSDGRMSDYGPWSDPIVLDGTQSINLADLEIGSPFGDLTVTKRRIFVRLLSFDSMRRNILWVDVNNNSQTTVNNTEPVFTLTGFRFGPASRKNGTPPTPGTFTATESASGVVDTTYTAGRYAFKMVAVFRNDVETPPSTISNTVVLAGNKQVDLTSVPTPADFNGFDVVYRKFYYSIAFTGTPDFLSGHTNGWYWVPNNTDVSITNPFDSSDFRSFNEQPSKAAFEPGPNLEDDPDPDDLTDDNTDLLKEPPISRTIDNSQIRTRVFVKGKGTTVTTAASSGASTLVLADGSFFSAAGGQVFVGWRVLNYISRSSNTLTLESNLDEDIPAGTAVHLWVQRDDYSAQSDLAAIEGGDGIHEYLIPNNDLGDIESMEERGDAELSLYSRGIVTVSYSTRDRKSKSGKNIVVNLTNPPISVTLKIQEVQIDQIHDADDLVERYRVTASSVRFTIDDFLRRVQLTR